MRRTHSERTSLHIGSCSYSRLRRAFKYYPIKESVIGKFLNFPKLSRTNVTPLIHLNIIYTRSKLLGIRLLENMRKLFVFVFPYAILYEKICKLTKLCEYYCIHNKLEEKPATHFNIYRHVPSIYLVSTNIHICYNDSVSIYIVSAGYIPYNKLCE